LETFSTIAVAPYEEGGAVPRIQELTETIATGFNFVPRLGAEGKKDSDG
jgi:hypothetical protein